MAIMQTMKYEAERDGDFARWATSQTGGENLRHCTHISPKLPPLRRWRRKSSHR